MPAAAGPACATEVTPQQIPPPSYKKIKKLYTTAGGSYGNGMSILTVKICYHSVIYFGSIYIFLMNLAMKISCYRSTPI